MGKAKTIACVRQSRLSKVNRPSVPHRAMIREINAPIGRTRVRRLAKIIMAAHHNCSSAPHMSFPPPCPPPLFVAPTAKPLYRPRGQWANFSARFEDWRGLSALPERAALQAKKAVATKKHKSGLFTIDASQPVQDEIFDIAAFVCARPPARLAPAGSRLRCGGQSSLLCLEWRL